MDLYTVPLIPVFLFPGASPAGVGEAGLLDLRKRIADKYPDLQLRRDGEGSERRTSR